MVEGGATIIASFLDALSGSQSPHLDRVIITMAPMVVGSDGVGYANLTLKNVRLQTGARISAKSLRKITEFCLIHSEKVGKDVMLTMKVAT